MICEVLDAQAGGYSIITTFARIGFLPSATQLTRGKYVSALFVKVQDGILLFAPYEEGPDAGSDHEHSGVPRKPLPDAGSGSVTLPEPELK